MTKSPSDRGCVERVMASLRAAVAGAAMNLFVACKPMPAPRRNVSLATGTSFMPREYCQHAAEVQRQFHRQVDTEPFDGPCTVFVEVVGATPKASKLPGPRGDVDNFAKTYMDAITKMRTIWLDDTQVTALISTKRWAKPGETPGVHVTVIPTPTN